MKYLAIILLLTQMSYSQTIDYVKVSQDFIQSAKFAEGITQDFIDIIATADETELLKQLKDDNYKKAFFINVYNGFTNYALKKDPTKYKSRSEFFTSKQFVIAGNTLSLDDIEHGFLRKSSIKLSMGQLKKPFPSKLEKKYQVDKLDYRIHFSLNCGAKSCPPIFFYDPATIDEQLDKATKSYLTGDASYDKEKNILSVPILMSWFRGDFGNKQGILKICSDLNILPKNVDAKLAYNDYDWSLYLENFTY